MTINAGAAITPEPRHGLLPSTAAPRWWASDVTLVFTSKNRSGFAIANINGNVTIDLRPPKTGPLAGIVTFGDRGMPTGTSFKFNGGATQHLGGAVYLPKGAIEFSGGAGTARNCTQLIGDAVSFTGNSKLALNCANYDA